MTETDRLQLMYEMNQRVLALREIPPLVHFASRRVRELFDAAGCALLVLDRSGEYLEFYIESQGAAAPTGEELRRHRVPVSGSIAGRVLTEGKPLMLADAASNPDVFRGVDEATGQKTQTLLCAPVITQQRKVGVIEVVNAPPERLTEGNLQFLQAIAEDIAVAYELANWLQTLRAEAEAARRTVRVLSDAAVIGGFLWCALVFAFSTVGKAGSGFLGGRVCWFGVAIAAGGWGISLLERGMRGGMGGINV